MKKTERKQFAIYSRKSKFTGKGESIGNQIELCRQYIAVHYSEEEADAAQVYEDEGFSGGTLERPQFKQMMQDSKTHQFAAIVVYRLDRISRNIGDFAKLIEDLGYRKIDFISIREQFDTSSPMGRAMMYIASVFSQLERETIAERIRDNMHELAKTGRWLGGTTPTGYESESVTNVTIDGKVKKACKLKIIPEEIQLVRTIFEKFTETGSLTKVDQFLLEKRIVTKRGNRFTRFTLKGILSNPVYMIADETAWTYLTANEVDLFADKADFDGRHGIMAYNRTSQQQGKAHQIKPMGEWIVSVGKHEGVISGEMWVNVQTLLALNKSSSYRKPRSEIALLSGLLYCGNCGAYMRPKRSDRLTADGEPIYTYLCTEKERSRSGRCAIKNANGNILDAKILEEIKKLGKNNSDSAKQITQAKKGIRSKLEEHDEEINKLKEQIAENNSAIRNLVTSLTKSSGTIAEKYIVQQIEELHAKEELLKKQLEVLEGIRTQHVLTDKESDIICQMLSTFGDILGDMTVEQKRSIIRTFINRVVWDGDNAHLYLLNSDVNYVFSENPSETCRTSYQETRKPLCKNSE